MTLVEQLAVIIGTPVGVLAVLAFFGKTFLSMQIEKGMEKFKADLVRAQAEHSTRFSLLHEKRLQVISELYAWIARAVSHLVRIVHPIQPVDPGPLPERKQKFVDVANDTQGFYFEHRLFFSDSAAKKIEEILGLLHSAYTSFDTAQTGDKHEPDPTGLWKKAREAMDEKWPALEVELRTEFQSVLNGSKESKGKE